MRHSHTHTYRPVTAAQFFYSMFNSKLLFPIVLLVWFMYFAFASSSSSKLLRGAAVDNGKVPESKFDVSMASIRRKKLEQFEHLVIVAGHAVMRINKLSVADKSDTGWYLLAYQKNQGFPGIISSHIKKGVDLLNQDDSTMLVFSGGQTRKDVGPTSEAASYYYLAQEKQWIKGQEQRVYLEEFARDSFENLLFSLCRFREVAGHYPSKISVVGFDFKGRRFSDLHRRAIGFPGGNFTYLGVRSGHANFDQAKAERGEEAAVASFDQDLYGCSDPTLAQKREVRNPFRRTVPYELACPEMSELLHWCGPGLFSAIDALPWASRRRTDKRVGGTVDGVAANVT